MSPRRTRVRDPRLSVSKIPRILSPRRMRQAVRRRPPPTIKISCAYFVEIISNYEKGGSPRRLIILYVENRRNTTYLTDRFLKLLFFVIIVFVEKFFVLEIVARVDIFLFDLVLLAQLFD